MRTMFLSITLEVYIRTEWEFTGQEFGNKSLKLSASSWTSSLECSETDCGIRCAKLATCTAFMFLRGTGNCTLVQGAVYMRTSCGGGTSVHVKDGGFLFLVGLIILYFNIRASSFIRHIILNIYLVFANSLAFISQENSTGM